MVSLGSFLKLSKTTTPAFKSLLFLTHFYSISQNTSQPQSYTKMLPRLCLLGNNKINPKDLKNILDARKRFYIIIVIIHVKSICAGHKVPFQFVKHWNFIGKQSIKMMLSMKNSIKLFSIAVAIVRRQLKTIQIFYPMIGLVAVEMLEVGNSNKG